LNMEIIPAAAPGEDGDDHSRTSLNVGQVCADNNDLHTRGKSRGQRGAQSDRRGI